MSTALKAAPGPVRSLVPARMDRLPWTRFHWLVIIGLGVSWILDGLEIQIASTVGTVLQDKHTLHLTTGDVGSLGSVYLFGEVVGALVFGRITDMIGRKKMFVACLGALSGRQRPRRLLLQSMVPAGSAASWPAWASAASIPPSTRPSTS